MTLEAGSKTPDRRLIWKRIEIREREGLGLTDDENRASEIRETIFDIAIAAKHLLEDPKVDEDEELRRDLIDDCEDSLVYLRDELKVEPQTADGKNPDLIQCPLELATYAAGILAGVDFETLPRQQSVLLQSIECSTASLQESGIREAVARAQVHTPEIRSWILMDRRINLVSALLAFE